MAFIFGGNTGNTYEDVQRQRKVAEALLAESAGTPRNVGEGLTAIGNALAYKAIEKRAQKAEDKLRGDFNTALSGVFGGGSPAMGSQPSYTAPKPPTEGEAVANDTMSVLGNFSGLESQYGLPAGYLDRTYQIESGGNPNAQNPNSSAGGGFQFIDSTAKAYGLTDKTDLAASADAAARLARDNAAQLRSVLGRDPTAAELYLAHQQGGGGASALLANPNAPAVDIVGADAVRLNGGNPNMTAGEFAGLWLGKFGGNAQPAQAPQMDLGTLSELAGNPYATPGQKAVLEALIGQQMQVGDPMRQIELQKAQLELAQLKEPPKPQAPASFQALDMQAQAAGLIPGSPEYQQFMMTGGQADTGVPAAFAALDAQAQAAGFVPGSPEYKDFMATRGAGLAEAAKITAGAAAEAEVAAPADMAAADKALAEIEDIKSHPGLDIGTGASAFGNVIPGTSGYDFQNRVNQVKSGAFLTAIDQMRGMGSLSNAEGQTATAAVNRMDTATSKEEFLSALADYEAVIKAGRDRAQKRLKPTAGQAKNTPDISDDDLLKLYGN
jgi:hypothetical protein